MPRMVESLTPTEEKIAAQIKGRFSIEQQSAYYLTKTIRSVYQMEEEDVVAWRDEILSSWQQYMGEEFPYGELTPRQAVVMAYSVILVEKQMYEFHLDYWLRAYQEKLLDKLEDFFSSLPPHLAEGWDVPEQE